MPLHYKVIEWHKRDYLEEKVNRELKEGWQLQGGVSVSMYHNSLGTTCIYAQAMTKEEESEC